MNETQHYPNLTVYIPELRSPAVLTRRVGEFLVVQMPDGTWRNIHGSMVYMLH